MGCGASSGKKYEEKGNGKAELNGAAAPVSAPAPAEKQDVATPEATSSGQENGKEQGKEKENDSVPKDGGAPIPALSLGGQTVTNGRSSTSLAEGRYFAPRQNSKEHAAASSDQNLSGVDSCEVQDAARRKGGGSGGVDVGEVYKKVIPVNAEGRVDKEQFLKIIKRACPEGYESDAEILRLFDEIDLDGSGDLDFEEFEDWTLHDLEGQEVLVAIKEKLEYAVEKRRGSRLSALGTQELQDSSGKSVAQTEGNAATGSPSLVAAESSSPAAESAAASAPSLKELTEAVRTAKDAELAAIAAGLAPEERERLLAALSAVETAAAPAAPATDEATAPASSAE